MADDETKFIGTEIYLWGERIGAAVCNDQFSMPRFEYDPEFIKKGLDVSPIKMPLSDEIYSFPDRENRSLHNLPGLLASSLPDKFGDNLIRAWLIMNGWSARSLDILEELCFVGIRGMGALEYRPAMNIGPLDSKSVEYK
jgi:serine/threonine-protein kinase HipA